VGLVTAIEAVRAGLTAVVVEPRAEPIDKACGEGLMPSALAQLARLGVDPPGHPLRGIDYRSPHASARATFTAGAGRGVRRTALHASLSQAASAVGVRRMSGRVGSLAAGGDPDGGAGWVRAAGVTARYLAVADGLHSPTRRGLGLEDLRRPDRSPGRAPRYGLRRHFTVEPWSDLVEVHWGDRAEAYVTPVAERCVGVAVLCTGGGFDANLDGFPELRARLAGATAVSTVRGAGPLRQRARAVRSGRALLVGDAAGYVDALTGEGLRVGFAAARELVHCVLADRPGDYPRAWRRASRSARLLTEVLVWASRRPQLRARIVPAAQHWPGLFTRAVDHLA
jgi:flavin-dependent dehydrogenase